MKGNVEIVRAAVAEVGYALQYASEELRGDPDIVMIAVSKSGCALQYATEELRCNRKIVIGAVSQNGHALQYATDDLRSDVEIVMTAVSKSGHSLEHAAHELKGRVPIPPDNAPPSPRACPSRACGAETKKKTIAVDIFLGHLQGRGLVGFLMIVILPLSLGQRRS